MKKALYIATLSILLAHPAQAMDGKQPGCPGIESMRGEMGMMMKEMEGMMSDMHDPAMKERMEKIHGHMQAMMEHMHGGKDGMMDGHMMMRGPKGGHGDSGHEAAEPPPEDHEAHH